MLKEEAGQTAFDVATLTRVHHQRSESVSDYPVGSI